MDLFSQAGAKITGREAPLAVRMRPRNLSEFVGQEEIVGPGRPLRRAIETDSLSSVIFYGPPGTGKTTLARIVAHSTKAWFEQLNAVTAGVADIRKVVQAARDRRGMYQQKTILFIDELHRFNKAQQDALLPYVEDGTVILIGATTENPYFEVNAPLVSRSRIYALKPLADADIARVIDRALSDRERGLGNMNLAIADGALQHMLRMANGDARVALNTLELAAAAATEEDGVRKITLEAVEQAVQHKALRYDREGDNHYDAISAFIKSMRGSDPDAALFWLAKMLEAGEDIKFIARRIVICAAEDVGNADPQALVVAMAAAQAAQFVGMPEAKLPLAQATLYVATAPKSNAVLTSILAAIDDVRNKPSEVPRHLKDASYPGATRLGHGRGYLYPHDYPGNFVPQHYFPEGFPPAAYYQPSGNGFEAVIAARLKEWHKKTEK